MSIFVECGHCKGTGQVEHNRASEVYDLALSSDAWTSTTDVATHLRISPESAANVLRLLLDLRLVERRGTGSRRPYEWRRKLGGAR